jgi:hypothetical protein
MLLLAFALPRIEAEPIATGVAVAAFVGAAIVYVVRAWMRRSRR